MSDAIERRADRAVGWASGLVAGMLRGMGDADVHAAAQRVTALRARHPDLTADALVALVIARTTRHAAAVGAATAGAAVVPGLGTLAALTLGTAVDAGATLRLHARMVLDIAALRGAQLTSEDARRAVMVVAGVSTAGAQAMQRAGREVTRRLGTHAAARWVWRAVPVVGVVSASGANALATRVIGRRADAYFSLGEAAMGDWRASVRAVTGLDARAPWRPRRRRPVPDGDGPPPPPDAP
jgi:hypothetical protein